MRPSEIAGVVFDYAVYFGLGLFAALVVGLGLRTLVAGVEAGLYHESVRAGVSRVFADHPEDKNRKMRQELGIPWVSGPDGGYWDEGNMKNMRGDLP